jgi:small subunit ribosomal protein S19
MSRSIKKGPWVDPKLIKKINQAKTSGRASQTINTYARSSEIAPEMVGFSIGVHNGRQFVPVNIKEEMVGHRLGEFSPTKKFVRHGGKIQKELEKAVPPKTPAA